MKKAVKKREGFVLIIVLLGLALMSVLGIAIMGATTSNAKMVKIDAQSQAAYYIAESGVNQTIDTIEKDLENNFKNITSDDLFFNKFKSEYIGKIFEFDSFNENFGIKPKAQITIEEIDYEGNPREYKIKSNGNIENSNRKVSTIVSIEWIASNQKHIIDDLLLYTKSFIFEGNNAYGEGGTIVMDGFKDRIFNGGGKIQISNIYFNGPVEFPSAGVEFGSPTMPGTIYINGATVFPGGVNTINGDLRIKGDCDITGAVLNGNTYIEGDVTLGSYFTVKKKVYYTGDLKAPPWMEETKLKDFVKITSVDSWQVPIREIELRDNSWYVEQGYQVRGDERGRFNDNDRWLVDNYKNMSINIGKGNFDNVVIISKGDIEIGNLENFTGALIAPNGIVKIGWMGKFSGVIVSKEEINAFNGGTEFRFKTLQDLFSTEDIPVVFKLPGVDEGGTEEGSSNGTALTIKSGVREE